MKLIDKKETENTIKKIIPEQELALYSALFASEKLYSAEDNVLVGLRDELATLYLPYGADNEARELIRGIPANRFVGKEEIITKILPELPISKRINVWQGAGLDLQTPSEVYPAGDESALQVSTLVAKWCSEYHGARVSADDALSFARKAISEGKVYAICGGEILAMAYIPFSSKDYARVSGIIVSEKARGKGYGKALLNGVCKALANEGKAPVIYARSDSPAPNSLYSKLGFSLCGELCELSFPSDKIRF